MSERITHLRIKIQSLTDESRNIRREANKVSGKEKWELNAHRTGVVRSASRLNLLTYGAMRGVPYHVMEKSTSLQPWELTRLFEKVRMTALRFGADEDKIVAWIEDAKNFLKGTAVAA